MEFGKLTHTSVSLRTCGREPNFSILEVESPEDLCLTPQSGEFVAIIFLKQYVICAICN